MTLTTDGYVVRPKDDLAGARQVRTLLSVDRLSKKFGATVALDEVSLSVRSGERVALLGENGAGKSTLAKIICGYLPPDSGNMALNGTRVTFRSPRDARAEGIVLIPQELAYVPDLTVAENIVLGNWPSRRGWVSQRAIMRAAAEQLEEFGVALPLEAPVGSLSLGEIQLVEILKALGARARLLVLDEPTAALTSSESHRLMELIEAQATRGVGIVFVSHRLDEVLRGTDTIHVFRDGSLHSSLEARSATRTDLVRRMTGFIPRRPEAAPGRGPRGSVSLIGWRHEPTLPHPLDVHLKGGEVTVLIGLRGSGVETITEALGGARRLAGGSLRLDGIEMPCFPSPRAARKHGVAYVPPDRSRQGLALGQSVRANLTVLIQDRISSAGWLRQVHERQVAEDLASRHLIRSRSTEQIVGQLSGGNQQKVLLASRLGSGPRVLVLQEPTRGVDVRSREEIHALIRSAAAEGAVVVVSTTDLEEAIHIGDRLVVMRLGELTADLRGPDRREELVLKYAEEMPNGN